MSMDGKDFNSDLNGLSFKSALFGIGANYSWIQTKSFLFGIFKWRGVSFGAGFLYNNNEVDFAIDLDPISESITGYDLSAYGLGGVSGDVVLNPSFVIGLHSTTYTIPLDVTTSMRVLWLLNFNLGAGLDFNFGTTDIILEANGRVTANVPDVSNVTMETTDGTITVDGSTKGVSPSIVHARITTGFGLNFGPLKFDIPIIIYPLDSAFAAGVTAGIVW